MVSLLALSSRRERDSPEPNKNSFFLLAILIVGINSELLCYPLKKNDKLAKCSTNLPCGVIRNSIKWFVKFLCVDGRM